MKSGIELQRRTVTANPFHSSQIAAVQAIKYTRRRRAPPLGSRPAFASWTRHSSVRRLDATLRAPRCSAPRCSAPSTCRLTTHRRSALRLHLHLHLRLRALASRSIKSQCFCRKRPQRLLLSNGLIIQPVCKSSSRCRPVSTRWNVLSDSPCLSIRPKTFSFGERFSSSNQNTIIQNSRRTGTLRRRRPLTRQRC
jgi:hypothetical protein